MHPDHLLHRLGFLAFALVLASPGARAVDRSPVANDPSAAALSAPPAFPDSAHIPNDCHLSTVAYLTRYLAMYPSESGEPLVLAMHNDAGQSWHHTVAIISWHGQTWCREEHFGVFALDCSFAQRPNPNRLAIKAESALRNHARLVMGRSGADPLTPPPSDLSAAEKIQDVTAAVHMVPFPATVYWIRNGKTETPMAFFRPNSRQIAVYEPLHGTCLAECASHDDARIVALVAARIGFRVNGVRAGFSSEKADLVASADSSR
jgi:hypothetical protein